MTLSLIFISTLNTGENMNWEIYHTILSTGEHYVGQHYLGSSLQDLTYLGSGTVLQNRIQSFSPDVRNQIRKEQLKVVHTPEETNDYERLYIYLCRKIYGDSCINIASGGNGKQDIFAGCSHSEETKTILSKLHKGRIRVNNGVQEKFVFPDEIPEGYKKGILKRRYFISDGKILTSIQEGTPIPEGFHRTGYKWSEKRKESIRGVNNPQFGKTPSLKCREATSKWLKENNPSKKPENKKKATERLIQLRNTPGYKPGNFGKHYYNNGQIEIFLSDNEPIPRGFKRGRLKSVSEKIHPEGKKPANFGKCYISNGEIEILVDKNSVVPEGFKRGRLSTIRDLMSKGN